MLQHFSMKAIVPAFLLLTQTIAQGTFLAINLAGFIDNQFTSDNEVWINQYPQISTKVMWLIFSKNN